MTAHDLTHLDLFSGIGGFALAAQWAGFRTIGFSEIEPFCCRVLEEEFPGVPLLGDIRHLATAGKYLPAAGTVTVLTGGFPCQPFSTAGKRKGKDDDRYLWPAMLRVIKVVRPAWVIGENVPGVIDMALDDVLDDLEDIGYTTQPFVVPACAVGAFQYRKRVWICAHSKCEGLSGYKPLEGASSSTGETHAKSSDEMPCSWDALARHSGGLRSSDGLSVSMVRSEIKGYGNAIVPQVAEKFLRWIAEIEMSQA